MNVAASPIYIPLQLYATANYYQAVRYGI